jgi:hypothetical protein
MALMAVSICTQCVHDVYTFTQEYIYMVWDMYITP